MEGSFIPGSILDTEQSLTLLGCGQKVSSRFAGAVSQLTYGYIPGLAEACVHGTDAVNLFLPALFDGQTSSGGITSVISRVASLGLSSSQPKKSSPHALEILARILKDPDFSPKSLGLSSDNIVGAVEKVATACEAKLLKFFGEWAISPDREDLLKKTEEVIWMNAVIYTIGGWSGRNKGEDEKKEFNADFFL